MTSPVNTDVKNISSAMSGAPTLNGLAGSLIALIDAFAVNGYDIKSGVSITVASGIATATWTGTHSCDVETVVSIAGVTGPLVGLNGEQKIASKPSGVSATWLTNEADGTASGTITMKMAPLGWIKVYSAANKAVYKSGAPGASGMLLRVDDTGGTSARVVGYEAMSDVDTGVNPFPSVAQVAGGGYWPKSTLATAAATQYQMFGDAQVMYFNPLPGSSAAAINQMGSIRGFGDPLALKQSGDPYSCFLSYSVTSAIATMVDGGLESNIARIAMPRSYAGIGSSVLHYTQSYIGTSSTTEYSGVTAMLGNFPGDVDGGLYLSKKFFGPSGQNYPRADVPGLFHIPQGLVSDALKQGAKVPGTRDQAGRTLIVAMGSGSSANFSSASTVTNTGVVLFDATGPWR